MRRNPSNDPRGRYAVFSRLLAENSGASASERATALREMRKLEKEHGVAFFQSGSRPHVVPPPRPAPRPTQGPTPRPTQGPVWEDYRRARDWQQSPQEREQREAIRQEAIRQVKEEKRWADAKKAFNSKVDGLGRTAEVAFGEYDKPVSPKQGSLITACVGGVAVVLGGAPKTEWTSITFTRNGLNFGKANEILMLFRQLQTARYPDRSAQAREILERIGGIRLPIS